jgi:hypothetical protein
MIGLTAVVVTFSNGIINSATNLAKIGQYIAKTDSLEKRLKKLEDKETYAEMRIKIKREEEEQRQANSRRFDDSLLRLEREFNRKLLSKFK